MKTTASNNSRHVASFKTRLLAGAVGMTTLMSVGVTDARAGLGSLGPLLSKGKEVLSTVADVTEIASGIKNLFGEEKNTPAGGTSSGTPGGAAGDGSGGSSIIGDGEVEQKIDSEDFEDEGTMSINSIFMSKSGIGKLKVNQEFNVKKLKVEKDASFSANSLIVENTRLLGLEVEQIADGQDWQMMSGSTTVVNHADVSGLMGGVLVLKQSADIGKFHNKSTAHLNVFSSQGKATGN